MGMTHNEPATQALLALHLGRIRARRCVEAVRAIVTMQREQRRAKKSPRRALEIHDAPARHRAREARAARDGFGIALQDSVAAALPPVRDHLGWLSGGRRQKSFLCRNPDSFRTRARHRKTTRYRSAIRRSSSPKSTASASASRPIDISFSRTFPNRSRDFVDEDAQPKVESLSETRLRRCAASRSRARPSRPAASR